MFRPLKTHLSRPTGRWNSAFLSKETQNKETLKEEGVQRWRPEKRRFKLRPLGLGGKQAVSLRPAKRRRPLVVPTRVSLVQSAPPRLKKKCTSKTSFVDLEVAVDGDASEDEEESDLEIKDLIDDSESVQFVPYYEIHPNVDKLAGTMLYYKKRS